MAQTQKERLTAIMDGALGSLKLADKCKGEASGPQLVNAIDPQGNPGLTIGWQFTVWLDHNKLIGQDPIGVTVPVGTLLPSRELVEMVTVKLLDAARELRQQANSPVPSQNGQGQLPSMDEVLKTIRDQPGG
jgi:hypothetical protein